MLFNGADVTRKAIKIIETGQLTGNTCSDWCPWCAITIAKGKLDDEYGTGLDAMSLIGQFMMNRIIESPGDEPLVEARDALSPFNSVDVLSQEDSLHILRQANKSLEPTVLSRFKTTMHRLRWVFLMMT